VTKAIYIDFETRKTKPLRPALLGVLSDTRGATKFEQVILDNRLYDARRARPHLSTGTLEETVRRLLAADAPIVAWSVFEDNLVGQTEIDARLKREFHDRYVNALTVARTWRSNVHPTFKILPAGPFDPTHTLDRYAELAGYPDVAALRGAKPAEWIAHTLDQIESRKRYSRITPQAKRDWHKLLEYNDHDCKALRHVHQRATFELEKWRAYEKTTYCVNEADRRPICFRAGNTSEKLDTLLTRYGATRWALLSAWNPGSQPPSRAENDRRQLEMLDALTTAGYRCLCGEGRGDNSGWCEEHVLVLDIAKRDARRLGRRFGQLAIIVGHRGSAARLVSCEARR
jgi:hypothetical protein